MLINLTELFSVDGKEKDYTCDIDINQLCTSKDAYDIVSRSPVKLHVRNLGDKKLLLTGNAEVTLQMPCDRCLEPVIFPLNWNSTKSWICQRPKASVQKISMNSPM